MKIYEIQEDLYKCFDEETGEILDPEKFEELQGELDEKIERLGCMIKNDAALIKGLKEEKKRIMDRIASLEHRTVNTKDFLKSILNGRKFETPKVRISYMRSRSVEIADESIVPEEFCEIEEVRKVKKTEIKQAIMDGAEVAGCNLIENKNLIVK